MPNLQQWLNAWVNVNVPAKNAPRRSRSRSRGRRQSSGKHHNQGSSQLARGAVDAGAHQQQHHHHPHSTGGATVENLGDINRLAGSSTISLTASSDSPANSTSTGGVTDIELKAIRKFNSKKHKRRLHRTNSFSDILRDQAERTKSKSNRGGNNGIGSNSNSQRYLLQHEGDATRSPQVRPQRHRRPAPPTLHHKISEEDHHDVHEGGASADSSSHHSSSPAETATTVQHSNTHSAAAMFEMEDFPGNDGPMKRSSTREAHRAQHGLEDEQPQYLRSYVYPTDTDIQQYLQNPSKTQAYDGNNGDSNSRRHSNSTSSTTTTGVNRYYDRASSSSSLMPPSDGTVETSALTASTSRAVEPGLYFGGVRLPFFSSTASAMGDSNAHESNVGHAPQFSADNNISKQTFVGKGNVHNCSGCKVAQGELQHTQESLEYMREMAIQGEYCCCKCRSDTEVVEAPDLKKESKQLSEVTERHQVQIAQLIRQQNQWQQTMHLNHEKLTRLCQHMDTESAGRSEDLAGANIKLEELQTERDQLTGQVETLRAAVVVYENEREDYGRVRERMSAYEHEGLQQLEKGITRRDQTIAKLSERLEITLETLAVERAQQRQRRQIFFPQPASKTNGDDDNDVNLKGVPTNYGSSLVDDNQQTEVERLRADLLESQRKLETSQREAKQKETALLFRCELLEKKANQNGAKRGVPLRALPSK